MNFNLSDLAKQASAKGWTTGSASLFAIQSRASRLGWHPVENRAGDGGVTHLVSTSVENAPKSSLSATYGTGEQPLHTDGAHLRRPPQFVALHCAQPSSTPTLLWSPLSAASNARHPVVSVPDTVRGGVFLISKGSERFLTVAHSADSGWRYDPACMSPCDQRARKAVDYFASLQAQAFEHQWSEPGQVLVIDNRRTLHARAAVSDEDPRTLTRLSFSLEENP